jgi:hypothetical protein
MICELNRSGSMETSFLGKMIFIPKQYSRELRDRAVRMVIEHRGEYETEYAAIRSIAAKNTAEGMIKKDACKVKHKEKKAKNAAKH